MITKKILFKYERVRILGERINQLTLGAKPLIKNIDGLSYEEIAIYELENKILPFIILRKLPNGIQEKIKLSDIKINKV